MPAPKMISAELDSLQYSKDLEVYSDQFYDSNLVEWNTNTPTNFRSLTSPPLQTLSIQQNKNISSQPYFAPFMTCITRGHMQPSYPRGKELR